MSLQIQCSECGEFFAVGAPPSLHGTPCHRCQQKKAQFAAEIAATYEKNKSKAVEVGTQIHTALLQAEAFKRFSDEHPSAYVVPADAPMVPGRKLRDALVLAGQPTYGTAPKNLDQRNDLNGIKIHIDEPAPRRSFVSTTARVAFWIVLAVTVGIWIFSGVKS